MIKEKYNIAMIVMITRLGKTYLTALFAQNFPKILFIAQREEILTQAKSNFERVLKKRGRLYYGAEK